MRRSQVRRERRGHSRDSTCSSVSDTRTAGEAIDMIEREPERRAYAARPSRAARLPLALSGRSKSRATGSSQPDLAWRSSVSVFMAIPSSGVRGASCPSRRAEESRDRDARHRFVERHARDRHARREGGRAAATASPRTAARTRRDRRRGGSAGRTPAPAARGRCGRHRRVPPPASRRAAWSTVGLGQGTPSITTSRSECAGHVDAVAQRIGAEQRWRADRRGRCRPACRCRSDRHAARRAAGRRARAGRRCGAWTAAQPPDRGEQPERAAARRRDQPRIGVGERGDVAALARR